MTTVPTRVPARTDACRRTYDGCCIVTEPLSRLVRSFVDDWNRTRPASPDDEVSFVGAVSWLAMTTGLPEKTVDNVRQGRNRTTELRIADPLLAAIDRPYVLSDGEGPRNLGGTIEIHPNPRASASARAACCGGSLTGSAYAHGLKF